LVGWLVDGLIGRLTGWLVGWLIDYLEEGSFTSPFSSKILHPFVTNICLSHLLQAVENRA
jgi:hypothetical protein